MPLHAPAPQDQAPIQSVNVTRTTETVLILDWDDTLLCSSFLAAHQFRLDSELYDLNRPLQDDDSEHTRLQREVAMQLRELEQCVCALLNSAASLGQSVYIVTNAEQGWVELSAARFLPSVVPHFQRVTVISARSTYEGTYGPAPVRWKHAAMQQLLLQSGFFGFDGRPGVDKHVISLGDAHVEREAVRAVCSGVPSTRTKSVKFAERPTAEQLRRQLELVNQCFHYIHNHDGDLDLQLTVTLNPPAAPPQPNAEPNATVPPPVAAHDPTGSLAADLLSGPDAKDTSGPDAHSALQMGKSKLDATAVLDGAAMQGVEA